MGDRKSEAGSRVEAPQKKSRHHPPIIFLLQHADAPDSWPPGPLAPWLLGSLAPWLLGSLAPWLLGSLAPWLLFPLP
jgi:hypothetical protein